jgi:hypothetical protein
MMPVTLVNPMNETMVKAAPAPPRLESLAGKRIGLLDISKFGGSFFLDRLERILRERYQVADVLRARKPTFAKNAPDPIIEQLRVADAVIEALAD